MKTKKFFMTFLLAMGMIIAKAANGFPPELVLVSQPVLTYNANSVTIYYDVQNIGDYTYKGHLYLFLDPDDGNYYAKKYMKVRPGRIKRFAVTIPAYRPNPSWVYTVMPYYSLGDDLFSFTTFEYFEPIRFCWYGYHDEPWVVIHVGPRPHSYHRPAPYRFYYDGYYPILPPPPGGYPPSYYDGLHPLSPAHHTYAHHHNNGGYPANHHPAEEVPGYNKPDEATVVRPGTSNTPGSMSSRDPNATNSATPNTNNNTGVTTRPSNSGSNNTGATTRPSTNTRTGRDASSNSSNSGSVSRPSNNSGNNSGSTRPSGNSNSIGRSGSGSVNRPSNNSSTGNSNVGSGRSTGSSNSGRSTGSSNSGRSTGSSNSGRSSSSSNSGRSSGSSNSSNSGGRTPSGSSRGR